MDISAACNTAQWNDILKQDVEACLGQKWGDFQGQIKSECNVL